jgi:hypothetical protein
MYSFNTYIVNKSTSSIIDNMDDKFDDINDKVSDIETKLQQIEDLINVKLDVCYKKVNDVYSMQNKVNEITKMNNQSIIHQINQYDEEINDFEQNQKQAIFNSVEPSMSPQGGFDKLNNKCFIKHNTKNQERDMFYMSSINKNELNSKNKLETSSFSETSTKPEQLKPKNTFLYNNDISTSSRLSKNTKSSSNKSKEKSKKSSEKLNSINNEDNHSSKEGNIFTNLYSNNKKPNLRIVKDNVSL